MQDRLPFFADLEASQRASVALVVQTAVVNFVEWMQDPHSNVSYTAQAFELVPQDLTAPDRVAPHRGHGAGHHGVLRGSRAAAGPLRGAVDRPDGGHSEVQPRPGVHRRLGLRRRGRGARHLGQPDGGQRRGRGGARRHRPRAAVPRGRAELGHHRTGDGRGRHPGAGPRRVKRPGDSQRASQHVRDIAARHGRAALTDVHGTWLVAIVSGHLSPTDKFLGDLLEAFSDGPVVIGPTAPMLTAAYHSASEAISGMNAVGRLAWRAAARAGAGTAARTRPDGRRVGDRGVAHRRDAAAGRRRPHARRNP